MPSPEPRFARPADRVEPVASAVAFVLLLCIWVVGYVAVVPPSPAHGSAHIAVKVRA